MSYSRVRVNNPKFQNSEELLQRKFLFTEQEAKNAIKAVGSAKVVQWIISKNMHIKGLGLTKEYIYQFMMFIGEEAGEFEKWEKYSSLAKEPKISDNIEKIIMAYKAGLDYSQVSMMKDEDLTLSKLRVLAHLKSL